MTTVHMTDHDVANHFKDVLDNVRRGTKVVVEQDHRPVAVIQASSGNGRLLSEAIFIAKARGSNVTLDEGFMKHVEEGIAGRSKPWNPPSEE